MAANKIKGLTIEILGETTGLTKALAEPNKKAKDLQSELREVEKLLKMDPGNTELLAQKQQLLGDAVGTTKEKLELLREAAKQAQDQLARGDISEDQFRALQREIVKTEQEFESLEKKSKNFGSALAQQVKKAGNDIKDFGGKVTGVGTKLSVGVTAPIMAIGAASQVAFAEVDGALDTIVTKTGATGEALNGLEDSFKEVYRSLPVDAQVAGDAVGEVNTQFALTGDALEKATENMIKFSEINGQDVSASSIASKEAIEAFGLSTKDLDMVLDSVSKTAQNTGVATDKIFNSVTQGAPQLKAMGLNFAQSAAVMGSFEQKGIDSTKALSYLSKAQVTFAKDGMTMSEGLDALLKQMDGASSETEKLTIATEYFGTKGATFMLDAIQRGALDFGNFSNAAADAAGTVESTYEATLDPADKAKQAMNSLKTSGAELAQAGQNVLVPALDVIAQKLKEFSEWFSGLNDKTKESIVKIAGIVAVVGPLLVMLGTVISSVGTITGALSGLIPILFGTTAATTTAAGASTAAAGSTGLLTGAVGLLGKAFAFLAANPIVLVIAAIAAIVLGLMHLWKTNEDFRNAVIKIWETIKDGIGKAVDGIGKFFTETLPNAFKAVLNFFKDNWKELLTLIINPFAGAVQLLYKLNPKFKEWVDNLLAGFTKWLKGIADIGANIVEGLWNGIASKATWLKDKVTGFIDTIKSWFTGTEGFDTHSPSKWSEGVAQNVDSGFAKLANMKKALNAAGAFTSGIMNKLSGAISTDFDSTVRYAVSKTNVTQGYTQTAGQLAVAGATTGGDTIIHMSVNAADIQTVADYVRVVEQARRLGRMQ